MIRSGLSPVSGRPDLNPRSLDPQDGGDAVVAAQAVCEGVAPCCAVPVLCVACRACGPCVVPNPAGTCPLGRAGLFHRLVSSGTAVRSSSFYALLVGRIRRGPVVRRDWSEVISMPSIVGRISAGSVPATVVALSFYALLVGLVFGILQGFRAPEPGLRKSLRISPVKSRSYLIDLQRSAIMVLKGVMMSHAPPRLRAVRTRPVSRLLSRLRTLATRTVPMAAIVLQVMAILTDQCKLDRFMPSSGALKQGGRPADTTKHEPLIVAGSGPQAIRFGCYPHYRPIRRPASRIVPSATA
jgi:hypothetical protein